MQQVSSFIIPNFGRVEVICTRGGNTNVIIIFKQMSNLINQLPIIGDIFNDQFYCSQHVLDFPSFNLQKRIQSICVNYKMNILFFYDLFLISCVSYQDGLIFFQSTATKLRDLDGLRNSQRADFSIHALMFQKTFK